MVVALDRPSVRKPVRSDTPAAEALKKAPPPPPRTDASVRDRSASAPAADPRRSAGLSGLRGDLAMRGGHFARAAVAAPVAAVAAPVRKSDDGGGALGWLRDKGGDLVDGARRKTGELVDGAQDKAGEVIDGVERRVGQGVDAVKGAANAVTETVGELGEAFDLGDNIGKLGKGDKYKLAVNADVSVEGIKGYTKGNIEVARGADGKYTVSAEGELGGGLYAQLGGKVGGNASVDGEATLGAGAKVELSFDTAEEAERAADLMLRTASPPYALVKGGPPSRDDLRFLKDHASAVEVKGNAAAKVAAELGVGVRDLVGATAFAGAELKDEVALRIELPRDGKPAAVSVKAELSGKLEAGLQAGLDVTQGQPGKAKGGGLGWALQGEVTGKVSVEGKVEVPSLEREALLADPLGALGRGAHDAFRSAKLTTTVGLEGQGTAGKNGGGVEAKLAFEESPHRLLTSGAVERALRGDFGGAIDAAGKTVPVTASVTPFTEHGLAAKPELRVMGFGGGVGVEAIRRDYADQPLWAYSGHATGARDALAGWLEQEAIRYAELERGARRPAGSRCRRSLARARAFVAGDRAWTSCAEGDGRRAPRRRGRPRRSAPPVR